VGRPNGGIEAIAGLLLDAPPSQRSRGPYPVARVPACASGAGGG
jgi:hypothetical protein